MSPLTTARVCAVLVPLLTISFATDADHHDEPTPPDAPIYISPDDQPTPQYDGYAALVVDLQGTIVFLPNEMAHDASTVIECESHWDRYAVGSRGERGLLQIHPIHLGRIQSLGYSWDDMFDPAANLAVAESIWWERGWWPWSCRP